MSTSGIGRRRALAQREGNATYLRKRAEIVVAASNLFKERGYEATTLADIAEAVGSDRASIYYYVASKEELLQESVGDVTRNSLEVAAELRASTMASVDKIRAMTAHIVRSYDTNYPAIYVYIQEDMTKVGRIDDPWARSMVTQTRQYEEAVIALLRDGVEDGSFRGDLDVELMAKAFWGMLNWTHRWHKPRGEDVAERIAETFSAILIDGISSRRGNEPD